ncbi:MAG: hypothetical protein A2042_06980 [Candidatus Schekmanbacteria bacterium GWA2_38_11]|uniref:Uncharacterized protein n=1 Tax=Candidatus Schekmanbacteria bacterium GWA2_38_11 TaxID=1817876 RepID=A0A1F7RKP2_9BACT|nr:MAG: hypothetical protein A2042_06980 [Candidatus Schekmanbacteria bacterium GWA2_38_11]
MASISKPHPKHIFVQPSPRKLSALSKISNLGLKLSDGFDYQLHENIIAGVSLKQLRKDLAVIRESLSNEISKERESF